MATALDAKTLLHLAVIDHQVPWVEKLQKIPLLKTKRDLFGLSPVDYAILLGRKELRPMWEPVHPLPLKDFEYLHAPVFENYEHLEEVIGNVAKAKREDKIPSEKIWMGVYYDRELQKAIHPPVEIRHIDPEVGHGVFATKKIPACTYVGEYVGLIQQKTTHQLKEKRHCLRYAVWEAKRNFCIDAEHKGNFTRFLNHSAKPNLGLQSIYWRGIPRMIFISLREIREGAQLTFDYGSHFWKHHPESPKEWSDDL